MILPTLVPYQLRVATTPYDISYYEPMHKWKIVKKFAYVPKLLWEFEDSSSVIHSMIPDDYRIFIKTDKVVWLEEYYEIEAYTRRTLDPSHRRGERNRKRYFAVDEYYFLQKLL